MPKYEKLNNHKTYYCQSCIQERFVMRNKTRYTTSSTTIIFILINKLPGNTKYNIVLDGNKL